MPLALSRAVINSQASLRDNGFGERAAHAPPGRPLTLMEAAHQRFFVGIVELTDEVRCLSLSRRETVPT